MTPPPSPAAQQRLAHAVGTLLRAGVALSVTVGLLGGAAYLLRYGGTPAHYRVFSGEPGELRSITGVLGAAAHLSRRAWVQLALLLLVATPVVRVALSLFAFAHERDWRYVGITALVLGLLILSLVGPRV